MRMMPRVLLLLFGLSVITMLFVARCGLNIDSHLAQQGSMPAARDVQKSAYQQVLRELDRRHQNRIETLQDHINDLERQLAHAKSTKQSLANLTAKTYGDQYSEKFYSNFIHRRLKQGELQGGIGYNNEYEQFSFSRFTLQRIYLVEPGLGRRVIEKPIGYKKKEIIETVLYATGKMNAGRNNRTKKYTIDHFIEGLYRTEPGIGTHYVLFFKDIDQTGRTGYVRLVMSRPAGPVHVLSSEKVNTQKEWINLILPLSGRITKFMSFMERFVKVCIKQDQRVFLTVVYFGTEGLDQVKAVLGRVSKSYRFKNIKLITLNEDFSRGRGLHVGAQSWTQGNVLLFFCDVDIVFSRDFLERCRLNVKSGHSVYYPIVFSLYNPHMVYASQGLKVPSAAEQLVISRDTGFWRDFGFGMTCQYRSDFMSTKGFDEQVTGWGKEDVYLYRKYVKSKMMVIRATDPGLFHIWHEKACDPSLAVDQFRACIRSKALNEASHAQLGMLAFKDELDLHRSPQKSKN